MVATTATTPASSARTASLGPLDSNPHHIAFPTSPMHTPDPDASDYESVKLFPTEMRFVTGIARTYDDSFPCELAHLIKRDDFETAMNQINNTLKDYWPCTFCICWGYFCCPCTLGVSLLCPNLCIKDAEQYVRALTGRLNKRLCFARAGVEWRLVRSCGRSWIEITYPVTRKPSAFAAAPSYQSSLDDATMRTSSSRTASSSSASSARPSASSPLVVLEV